MLGRHDGKRRYHWSPICEKCQSEGWPGTCMCDWNKEQFLEKLGCPMLQLWAQAPDPLPFRIPPPKFPRLAEGEVPEGAADETIVKLFSDRVKSDAESSHRFSLTIF